MEAEFGNARPIWIPISFRPAMMKHKESVTIAWYEKMYSNIWKIDAVNLIKLSRNYKFLFKLLFHNLANQQFIKMFHTYSK